MHQAASCSVNAESLQQSYTHYIAFFLKKETKHFAKIANIKQSSGLDKSGC